MLSAIFSLIIGYLLGSVPFGLLLSRLAGKPDPRGIGSGNIGATNVLRSGGRGLALGTLLGDAAKGLLAVLLGGPLGAFAAVIGHIKPVWLKFRGGKGVAVWLGALWGLSPQAAVATSMVWLAAACSCRKSSVGALTAMLSAPIAAALFDPRVSLFATVTLPVLLWTHRDNWQRLYEGREDRIRL